ncbi:hypothetical protein F5J12DRAFT_905563 [Pisolithus orientalis]|uniref:uncharacterized protein n=1 Tax=Pisolithus orientalis TaxID=936130 RepID=UPI002224693A|nr:uncharacterized protein F5J12DRAFT_905563 [Pisolithus orientalis]KAI6007709.1 hypothetical protein F5J12DRAFT_905563 [Pisolithus orientalis]
MSTTLQLSVVRHMTEHVLSCLKNHRSTFDLRVVGRPSSRRTSTNNFQSSPHLLSVAVLSIDDLYLPHDGLASLARNHSQNRLLQGQLPIFDKSLFGGEGDRLPHGKVIRPPVDVFILEGWCVGFYPTSISLIEERWDKPVSGLEDQFDLKSFVRMEDVLTINDQLKAYIKGPSSSPYNIIYKWRLEQEHFMKARNGGNGMTDEQVKAFVDRYIPGYVFFGDGVTNGLLDTGGKAPRWIGSGLVVTIGQDRELIQTSKF